MSDAELAWTPAWRLRKMFAARQLSPLEFAQFLLARVEKLEDLSAFITVFPEHLLTEAKAATENYARGLEGLPLLHGLPVSLKDSIATKGQRTTYGSLLFKDNVPEVESVASERLKQSGGIVFAKTNLPEFELNRRSINLLTEECLNAWDRTRTSGGSSGGAGVATSAGLGPLALGTDGGGSIRIPSSFSGIFGLQPSRGRVPDMQGAFGLLSSVVGPMTRDVRDAAMLMQAVACCDERDPRSRRDAPPDYLAELDKGIEGLRVAWSADLGRVTPDEPAIIELCHEAAQTFRNFGVAYSEPSFRFEDPHDELELDGDYAKWKMAALSRKLMPGMLDPISWAMSQPREDYAKVSIYIRDRSDRPTMLDYALSIRPEVRRRKRTHIDDFFKSHDLLLCPVIARTAFRCGVENVTPFQYTAYTFITNVAGYCGASVPIGFYQGMPVGLQIIGRPGEEHLLLRAARAFERERPWAQWRPDVD
ncbi:MAG: amidase [Sphingomonadales bacterium]|nr:amidase [Sphingomonadales bacterium]